MPSPFWLERKKEVYKPKRTIWKRYIENIEYVGEEETTCIYIDDPSHLYITDDYIITHNTTLEKFFAAWVIGRHIADYSLFYSHSDDITRMFYDGVLDITTNDKEYNYSQCWLVKPVILYGVNAKRQTINFNTYKPFSSLQCTSVGAKNAGKVRCNRFLYCDDLIGGIEEALNKNQLDKLWEKYSVDARQRMLEGCKEIHIATRWSVHDVIGRLQNIHADNERAKFINIPALDEHGQSNFKYRFNGFKTKFFKEQQAIMEEMSFNALYMGQPIEREGLLYNKDEMRYYTELPNKEPDAIIGVCDTKAKGTDYMFLPCLYQYDNDYYLVDCVCDDTTNYTRQYNKLTDIIVNNKMQQVEFESNAGGDRVAFEVAKMVKNRGWDCNITTKPTTTNKETRIITYSDWVKKNILFKDPELYAKKSDYGQMMYWLFGYTQTGKNPHDDVPDGLANFAKFVERKYNVRPTMIMQSPF
jgi:predicted phage terminase large subunit-like protein